MRRSTILNVIASTMGLFISHQVWADGFTPPPASTTKPPFAYPAIGNDVTGSPTYKPIVDYGIDGSLTTPGLRFETMSGNQNNPLPGFGPFEFIRSGTDFTIDEGVFSDSGMMYGFNQCAGSTPCKAGGAVMGWSQESDYATEQGTDRSTITHAMEMNLNGATPPRVKIVFSGTPKTGDTISVTLTGANIPAGSRSYSVAATTGNTLAQQAQAWVNAFNADATTKGVMYAYTDGGANAWISSQSVSVNFLTSGATAATVTASGTVNGSSPTDVITVTRGDTKGWRAVELGVDRDRGPDGKGYLQWDFFIGSGTSGHWGVDTTNGNPLMEVTSYGYTYLFPGDIPGNSVNLVFSSSGFNGISSLTDFAIVAGNSFGFTFRSDGEFLLGGDGMTRITPAQPGLFRFSSNGEGNQSYLDVVFLGGQPTNLTGAGTGGAFANHSNDVTGRITVGSSPSGTITFLFLRTTLTVAPVCLAQSEVASRAIIIVPTPSAQGLTLTGSFQAGDQIGYHCFGMGAGT